VFRESYRWGQWLGLLTIAVGLAMFFRDQFGVGTVSSHDYLLGSAFVIVAAVVWAGYALIQKQLLLRLDSPAILLFIYALAGLLLPLAQPQRLLALDPLHAAMLAYCVLNTLVAYGAFAEALAHWEASRVSAILATTPLLCLAVVAAVHALWPGAVAPEQVSGLGYAGAVLVVAGSAMSSLLGKPAESTGE
jgi:drug/metabolite transporter (DMT)-like permease